MADDANAQAIAYWYLLRKNKTQKKTIAKNESRGRL